MLSQHESSGSRLRLHTPNRGKVLTITTYQYEYYVLRYGTHSRTSLRHPAAASPEEPREPREPKSCGLQRDWRIGTRKLQICCSKTECCSVPYVVSPEPSHPAAVRVPVRVRYGKVGGPRSKSRSRSRSILRINVKVSFRCCALQYMYCSKAAGPRCPSWKPPPPSPQSLLVPLEPRLSSLPTVPSVAQPPTPASPVRALDGMSGYPVVNGVTVLVLPPAGVVPDFDHPEQNKRLTHFLVFGIGAPLAFLALCQRFYTKLFLSQGLQLDDCEYPRRR